MYLQKNRSLHKRRTDRQQSVVFSEKNTKNKCMRGGQVFFFAMQEGTLKIVLVRIKPK